MNTDTAFAQLFQKISIHISKFGIEKFENNLDNLLNPNTKTHHTTPDSIQPQPITSVIASAKLITSIVCKEMGVVRSRINAGNANTPEEQLALSICVYLFKIKLNMANKAIAKYFNRKSHSFVTFRIKKIIGLDQGLRKDRRPMETIKLIEQKLNQ